MLPNASAGDEFFPSFLLPDGPDHSEQRNAEPNLIVETNFPLFQNRRFLEVDCKRLRARG